jgi:hypothetical protein
MLKGPWVMGETSALDHRKGPERDCPASSAVACFLDESFLNAEVRVSGIASSGRDIAAPGLCLSIQIIEIDKLAAS